MGDFCWFIFIKVGNGGLIVVQLREAKNYAVFCVYFLKSDLSRTK